MVDSLPKGSASADAATKAARKARQKRSKERKRQEREEMERRAAEDLAAGITVQGPEGAKAKANGKGALKPLEKEAPKVPGKEAAKEEMAKKGGVKKAQTQPPTKKGKGRAQPKPTDPQGPTQQKTFQPKIALTKTQAELAIRDPLITNELAKTFKHL